MVGDEVGIEEDEQTPARRITVAAAVTAALVVGGVVLVREAVGRLWNSAVGTSPSRGRSEFDRRPLASMPRPIRSVAALAIDRQGRPEDETVRRMTGRG